MAYSTAEGRRQLLDALAEATSRIGSGLESLAAAYELLDEHTADRLEEDLFVPTRRAYGKAQRVYAAFAERHGLAADTFGPQPAGLPSIGARGFIDDAVAALSEAGAAIASLQDSHLLPEVGDVELRAGLVEIRQSTDELPQRARELMRTLGR